MTQAERTVPTRLPSFETPATHTLDCLRVTLITDQLVTNSMVPTTTLGYCNSREQLTELSENTIFN